jgi:hypothetical protein
MGRFVRYHPVTVASSKGSRPNYLWTSERSQPDTLLLQKAFLELRTVRTGSKFVEEASLDP